MALESTQPLTETVPGGKGGLCVGLKTLPLSCADCLEIQGIFNLLQHCGPVHACNGIAVTLPYKIMMMIMIMMMMMMMMIMIIIIIIIIIRVYRADSKVEKQRK